MNAQISCFDEIIVDSFAGGGGASTGIELATGRVVNITLRMLIPRELYNAMGFPPDYVIDRDYMGNEYKKDKQVSRCGNAVCPPLAEAMVRANLPEWCGEKISTMEHLERLVAV